MLTVVVGAGYTGIRILQRLTNSAAIGLSRSAPSPDSQLRVDILDLDQTSTLPLELPPNYSVIYTVPPSDATAEDTRLIRLLDCLPHAPGRFVYISTTGVYGDHGGATVDENSDLRPGSQRSQRRLSAEQLVQQQCQRKGTAATILRVPGIYGPNRLGIDAARDAVPLLHESDAYPGNRIHVTDLVSCCIRATSADAAPGIYNVGDGDFRSSTWFAHEVARQCQLPLRPEISRARAEQEFSPLRLSFMSESRQVDTRKMLLELGVQPIYSDAKAGIQASLSDMAALNQD